MIRILLDEMDLRALLSGGIVDREVDGQRIALALRQPIKLGAPSPDPPQAREFLPARGKRKRRWAAE